MSNKIIILWGSIIILLITILFIIGINYEKEIKYINIKQEVKESVKKYIKENNIKDDFEITSEELESEGYLKEIKLDDKICAADISVKKVLIFKKYNIEFTCIKNKEQS
ncbi:MAG: hypothetical protein MR779_04750 [Tenericutes bacterium]|nr:hypothetical protein [Mycoplasmatota bacterium]